MSINTAISPSPQDFFAESPDATLEYRWRTTRRKKSIEQRFFEFHAANPEVYDLFLVFARKAKAVGFESYGAQALFERIRWHVDVETERNPETEPFKINNDYAAFYSRKAMRENEDLRGFFETRVRKAD